MLERYVFCFDARDDGKSTGVGLVENSEIFVMLNDFSLWKRSI